MEKIKIRLESMNGQEFNLKEEKLIELLGDPTRKQFIEEILENQNIEFIELYTKLKIPETTARHHLKQLEESGIIERFKEKGTRSLKIQINPQYITLVRKTFNKKKELAYYAMIGIDKEGDGFRDVVKRFSSQQIYFKKYYLGMTEGEVEKEVKESKEWNKLVSEYEIELIITHLNNFELITKDLENKLLEMMNDYEPKINITRGTKIHTIVFYSLGQKYDLECYYLPEGENSLLKLP
jgi:DNA-binding transcriptional ArsR family regulator